jgi:hypothetical protein
VSALSNDRVELLTFLQSGLKTAAPALHVALVNSDLIRLLRKPVMGADNRVTDEPQAFANGTGLSCPLSPAITDFQEMPQQVCPTQLMLITRVIVISSIMIRGQIT